MQISRSKENMILYWKSENAEEWRKLQTPRCDISTYTKIAFIEKNEQCF